MQQRYAIYASPQLLPLPFQSLCARWIFVIGVKQYNIVAQASKRPIYVFN